jgi:hypothetical protein
MHQERSKEEQYEHRVEQHGVGNCPSRKKDHEHNRSDRIEGGAQPSEHEDAEDDTT